MLSNTQKTFDISLDKEMKMSKDKQQNVYPSPPGAYNIVNSEIMSSSTHSLSSSLASPGDSGVQLLDSESDMASLMSMSGHDFIDKSDETYMIRSMEENDENSHRISVILNKDFQVTTTDVKTVQDIPNNELLQVEPQILMTTSDIVNQNTTPPSHDWKMYSQSVPNDFMKHSRTDVTRNVVEEVIEEKKVVETVETKLEEPFSETKLEKPLTPPPNESEQLETKGDNNEDPMQTSIITPMIDDQIVYRRQRRKKIKSQDTPKKRVSFHEDILNSTKIDDIHIDRGFITRQCSDGFYNEHTLHKNGIVLGRYSWAAEGDSSCYNRNNVYERDVKSEIITTNNGSSGGTYLYPQQNIISNSSSSSMSLDDSSCSMSSSSSSDGDFKDDCELGGIINGIKNIKKVPKSSCLKKPKHGVIDTKIVHENTSSRRNNLSRKISESNLLDTNNIFGSLKNIYKTLSSSVPLTQRGVPEGQEDFTTHSEYSYGTSSKRNSYSSNETLYSKSLETSNYMMNHVHDVVTEEEPVTEIIESSENSLMMTSVVEHRPIKIYKKPNLRLSRSEGFYPNYPYDQQQCEQNIILCDSNVYEHRGISYSYEYDQFQSTFQNETSQTSSTAASSVNTKNTTGSSNKKSSTIYQMLLDELSFLKRSESKTSSTTITPTSSPLLGGDHGKNQQQSSSATSTVTNSLTSTPVKKQQTGKMQSSIHSDWSSDTESISDIYDKSIQSTASSSKHLQSPLKKRNLKPNHYSIQKSTLTLDNNDLKSLSNSTPTLNQQSNQSTSKTSLINRFLRNVTQRKLFETKLNQQITNKFLNKNNYLSQLYNIDDKMQPNQELCNQLNREINEELEEFSKEKKMEESVLEKKQKYQKIKEKIIRQTSWCQQINNGDEMNFHIFKVQSAYNMIGENKPILLLITNTILFIFSLNNDQYYNEFMIPLKEIHFILIGPNQQTIYITNNRQTLIYFIITADSKLTQQIISCLEFIIRTNQNQSNTNTTTIHYQLPAIKQFALNDMIQLRYAIYQQTSVTKDEDFYHYNLVHIEDEQLLTSSKKDTTPLGPYHDGFLMYRKAQTEDRWQFGYFILKAGVLYMFTSPTTRIPIKVIQLYDGECYGVHRTPPRPRPHTFELFTKTESLEFAASDEYEASDWLQVFVQSASGTQILNEIKPTQKEEQNQESTTSACSLILTSEHLVTVRECFNFNAQNQKQDTHQSTSQHQDGGVQTLSCAAISDLTSFKIPSSTSSAANDDEQQSWCILEFSCREVSETSGDWILYFSSFFELNQFLSTFEVLWSYTNTQGDKFPLIKINETDNLIYRHASETYRVLQQAWISFQ
ncbi:serine-rich adhesin for platelets [Chrysoperla carnea]|uniref:serine-rich adhesin for platelets n=1 Tax=Chrysoperla carnea TaxID=189513 RepID=UPI001D08562A|nr:serine-rich adhesin for platelets [Chrysoperla carnea]